jgi:D-xylose transport system ATP-binding protein
MADEITPSTGGTPTSTAGSPPKGEPRLRLRKINKSFGAVRALTDVDLDLYPAEVIGLVGDNGAGKSTLVKTISGVGPADSGEMYIDGQQVHITSPKVATSLGIETVYQDLALCDNLDIVGNLFLGREEEMVKFPQLGPLNENDMELRTLQVLQTLDVKVPSVRVPVASLSGGQRQSIAVARTILRNAKVVMLDEPTAALGVAQTRQELNLIKRLREQGYSVIVISHNLADVFEVVDHVVVLRLGRRVGTFDIKNVSQEQIVAAITGAEFGELTKEPSNGNGNGNSNGAAGGK